jgi:hypothetical protein
MRAWRIAQIATIGVASCAAAKLPASSRAEPPPPPLVADSGPGPEAGPLDDSWVRDVGRADAAPPPRTLACFASLEELARYARRDVPCKTDADCEVASACEVIAPIGRLSDKPRIRALERRARSECEASCAPPPAEVVATYGMRGPPVPGAGAVPRFCGARPAAWGPRQ